ncbi:FHA domain-containing protein [Tessaracoccus bendigoensis DSM 12906]|uniref:FHA domain-containing protein n=1 Tax=Tessaracoccus bendigoensis DSM 12906 TaxID=1123357 RepID=A0A1M6N4B5_9ACTN|nr:FHA domain-containing protein [Tessaracoccus bendigoensis DSM 12906]
MASDNLMCPLGGEPLGPVPGLCGCGRFWTSLAEVDAERRPELRSPGVEVSSVVATTPPDADGCPQCGGPILPGATRCGFCGQEQRDRPAGPKVCLVVDGHALELPQGLSVVLGRESDYRQVRELFAGCNGVSRRHIEVLVSGAEVRFRDVGSRNGTCVDGCELGSEAVSQPLPVHLRLGMSLEMEIRSVSADENPRQWTGE